MKLFSWKKDAKFAQCYPANVVVVFTSATDIATITFDRRVKINALYCRLFSAGGTIKIWGDECGGKLLSSGPQVSAIGLFSTATTGATINSVQNAIWLNETYNSHYFIEQPWEVRNLYLSVDLFATQYILGFSYAL